jgi:predicted short-subunit dehydrogenase-like oxidoreductase (DUF2520 family)
MENYKITLLGSGNVAHHLCRAFALNKIPLHQLYSRNTIKGKELADFSKTTYISDINGLDADMYIFAVSDSAVPALLSGRKWNNKLLVHTAGSVPTDIFKPYSDHYGVIYPLQTFSSFRKINYHDVPFVVDSSDLSAAQILKKLCSALSCKVYAMDSEKRLMLHITAVFINNFVNHMFSIGKKLNVENNIQFDIYQPLIEETVAKILEADPLESQTGPARRNDKAVMELHINKLKNHPDWQKIYTFVSSSIANMYAKE